MSVRISDRFTFTILLDGASNLKSFGGEWGSPRILFIELQGFGSVFFYFYFFFDRKQGMFRFCFGIYSLDTPLMCRSVGRNFHKGGKLTTIFPFILKGARLIQVTCFFKIKEGKIAQMCIVF